MEFTELGLVRDRSEAWDRPWNRPQVPSEGADVGERDHLHALRALDHVEPCCHELPDCEIEPEDRRSRSGYTEEPSEIVAARRKLLRQEVASAGEHPRDLVCHVRLVAADDEMERGVWKREEAGLLARILLDVVASRF